MANTFEISGEFKVFEDIGETNEELRTVADVLSITEFGTYRLSLGVVTDYLIPFGQVSNVKRVYLKTNIPATIKIGSSSDTGYLAEGIQCYSGTVSAIYITTTVITSLDVLFAG